MSAGGAAGSQTAALEFAASTPPFFSPPSLQALEAVGRLRCSRGLAVEKYIGSFYRWEGQVVRGSSV